MTRRTKDRALLGALLMASCSGESASGDASAKADAVVIDTPPQRDTSPSPDVVAPADVTPMDAPADVVTLDRPSDVSPAHDSNTARRAAGLYTHGPERAHPRDMGRALRGCLTVRAIGCPIPPRRPSLPDVGLSLAWSRQVFFVRASETQALGGVPDLVYDGLRVGASVRFPIVWRLSLRLDAGFTYVGSTGELGDAFLPHATAYALDGAASLAVRLWRGLEARVGFDAKQYNVSANTEPGDRYVATGSSDLYLAGTVGVAWRD